MSPTLLILAAGMSSRYGQLKQLEPLGPQGQTLIDYAVQDAIKAGFGQVVFIIRKEIEEQLKSFYANRYGDQVTVDFVYQELDKLPEGFAVPAERKKPWGTAHAVLMADGVVNRPFVVINCDDFYSAASYQLAADFFVLNQAPACAVIGYQLGNTLSPNGTVARAICQVDDQNQLTDIVEFTKIYRIDGVVTATLEDGSGLPQDPEAVVSMNFWALQPEVFPIFRAAFADYLSTELDKPGAEFFIATAINQAAQNGTLPVSVISCKAPWFGITYPADKSMVMAELAALHQAGVYANLV